ncbi:MAG: MarC family protein [Burkholderiales bacterium]
MLDWTEYAKIFTSMLVIVNPLVAVPIFLGLTRGHAPAERQRIARITAIAVGFILTVACLGGEQVLGFFNISIAAFRVGGGILILTMALSMLTAQQSGARHTPEEAAEAEEKDSIAVVPLAIPLLAGPGAISTVIIYANQSHGVLYTGFLVTSGIAVAIAVWMALSLAAPILVKLGKTGMNVATRLMGLLLVAVSVEFITGGLAELLPGLA